MTRGMQEAAAASGLARSEIGQLQVNLLASPHPGHHPQWPGWLDVFSKRLGELFGNFSGFRESCSFAVWHFLTPKMFWGESPPKSSCVASVGRRKSGFSAKFPMSSCVCICAVCPTEAVRALTREQHLLTTPNPWNSCLPQTDAAVGVMAVNGCCVPWWKQ